jgi:hypothetical protein
MLFGGEYRSLSSSLCSFFHCPFPLSLLAPNILLSTMFWYTLSLRTSINVSYHVSHPYKTTGNILVLCILIFIFLDRKDKRSCTEWEQAFPGFSLLLIFSWIEFRSIKVVSTYLKCSPLSKELLLIFMLWLRPAFWYRDVTTYLVLSAFTSSSTSFLATTKSPVFFYIMYASAHYIKIISINQKLMCRIWFQAVMVYLNFRYGIILSKVEKQ